MKLNWVKKIISFSVKNVPIIKPSKKAIWKIGLFLVFVGVGMNFSIDIYNQNNFKKQNNNIVINIKTNNVTYAGFNEFRTRAINYVNGYHEKIEKDSDNTEVWNPFLWAFKKLLWGVLQVVHWLVLASAFMFDLTVDQKIFNDLVKNNESVYIAWAMVRDFLNLFFMLALLFSAFSTIFQVEKYHLKKIIILLVVMALLVNFSYPITRFVMDFSNSIMYFFVGLMKHTTSGGASSSSSALIAKMSDMGMLSKVIMEKADIPALILSIIFQFILFVTLFAFAINLLIRILAFAILLIFSPAGFTLSFFPSTSNLADSWWSSLIKYAVLGPLMIFFLLIANLMFNATTQGQFDAPTELNDVGFISNSLLFAIPVVFLWMGLIASQKFGGEASSTAMGIAKKTGNWVKNNGSRMAYRGVDTMSGHRISGGIGAVKRGWDRMDENYKSKSSARASKYAEAIGVRGAEEQNMHNQAAEYKKKGLSNDILKTMAQRGDAAAAHLLAENKKMDTKTFGMFMKKAKNKKVKDAVSGKVKQNRADLVALYKSTDNVEVAKIRKKHSNWDDDKIRQHIISKELGGLNAEQYAQQNWDDVRRDIDKLTANTSSVKDRQVGMELYDASRSSFNERSDTARADIVKRLNKNSTTSLRTKFDLPV
ncbi:MAG TPA: hypothetical protein ENJ27_00380 [Candidatus Moranbacteria bacterium]|nr:hypothetical protein [Candidatus Moranbacteria bacterium]